MNISGYLPWWWQATCLICTVIALGISGYSITMQFLNYRRPYEQRLTVRIQLIVPIFCITCLTATLHPAISELYLDPIREVYEAFVIYTFFSLLILILGGERRIITEICLEHIPSSHAIPIFGRFMRKIDLSDPSDFLMVKRGILQYVWFKPCYCLGSLVCVVWDIPKFSTVLLILYNISVTWSLYNLALFWKCFYSDLKPFNPWSKFLCVKLIIFASYWQGILIQLLAMNGWFDSNGSFDAAYVYQNGLLSVEMIGFAVLHSIAFSWTTYSSKSMPQSARMAYLHALKDCFGCRDLKWDFAYTLMGPTYYNYQNFEPTADSSLIARADPSSRMRRLQHGFRFENQGESRHWVNYGSISSGNNSSQSKKTSHDSLEKWDDSIAGQGYIPNDPNYPVISDIPNGHRYSPSINSLRRDVTSRSSIV